MKRTLMTMSVVAVAVSATIIPGGVRADDDVSPPDPRNRLNALTPKPAGTRETIVLQYGPYLVHPGSDLSRIDTEIASLDGVVVGARPAVRLVDGTEPPDAQIHIHHAHWVRVKDPGEWPNPPTFDYNDYVSWFFGTGEEKTAGVLDPVWEADPRSQGTPDPADPVLRYGNQITRGERMVFISMLHNKTPRPMVVWLEGRFDFIHGTHAQLRALGYDFHPLTPVLHGASLQAPRRGGSYTWPLDARPVASDPTATGVVNGLGHVWEAPFSGTIVIGSGHLHPGGRQVVVSNLGSVARPCGAVYGDDADNDSFPGRTILRISAYYEDGTFPSEDFQMGITQHGWRGYVRAGDRIAINGIYETTNHAYPDAMSFFGFYADASEPPAPGQECTARLINDPAAPVEQVIASIPNRPLESEGRACSVCDNANLIPARGPHTTVVTIAGFAYLPGNAGSGSAPVLTRGETLTVVNQDWAAGLVRHSMTSCRWPCNGSYASNYPFHDGVFDSGPLGWTPIDTNPTAKMAPYWTLDTGSLEPGGYGYYCRLHPTMHGAFYVDP